MKERRVKDVKISVRPHTVEQGGIVTVTVVIPNGGDPSSLLMRIVSAQGSATAVDARKLNAFVTRAAGQDAYACEISTAAFRPGEYLVDISPMASFELSGTISKKFTVEHQMPIVVSANASEPNRRFSKYWNSRGSF